MARNGRTTQAPRPLVGSTGPVDDAGMEAPHPESKPHPSCFDRGLWFEAVVRRIAVRGSISATRKQTRAAHRGPPRSGCGSPRRGKSGHYVCFCCDPGVIGHWYRPSGEGTARWSTSQVRSPATVLFDKGLWFEAVVRGLVREVGMTTEEAQRAAAAAARGPPARSEPSPGFA